jgi:3-mercaptopyruvate sulfurtransferase SseA
MTKAARHPRLRADEPGPRRRSVPLMNTRLLWLVTLALALGSPVFGQIANEAAVPRIRDAASYAEGHIPGAILIPLDAVQAKAPDLKRAKKPIVAYCA